MTSDIRTTDILVMSRVHCVSLQAATWSPSKNPHDQPMTTEPPKQASLRSRCEAEKPDYEFSAELSKSAFMLFNSFWSNLPATMGNRSLMGNIRTGIRAIDACRLTVVPSP